MIEIKLLGSASLLCLIASLLWSCGAADAREPLPSGSWNAWLECPGGPLRFGLSVEPGNSQAEWSGQWINGPERINIPEVSWEANEVVLHMPHYDSTIRAAWNAEEQRLEGRWKKRKGVDRWTDMAFFAEPNQASDGNKANSTANSQLASTNDTTPSPDGRWLVDFDSDDQASVGIFSTDGQQANGTFLTALGDYRFLAGHWSDGELELSCFDGAHAFLFRATFGEGNQSTEALNSDLLSGDFWSSDSWHEPWTAQRNPDAQLTDPFEQVSWSADAQVDELSFIDRDGLECKLGDDRFKAPVRLIQFFGTWCPNCHDEASYLVELHERYATRGLDIVGVAFEHTGELERDLSQIEHFAERHQVPYHLLLGGVSSKEKATEAIGGLDRLRSYPTLLFVDHKGTVRAVHSGFAGPATGAAHQRLRERCEGLIEELLAEVKA